MSHLIYGESRLISVQMTTQFSGVIRKISNES